MSFPATNHSFKIFFMLTITFAIIDCIDLNNFIKTETITTTLQIVINDDHETWSHHRSVKGVVQVLKGLLLPMLN